MFGVVLFALGIILGALVLHRAILCAKFAFSAATAHNDCEKFFYSEKMRTVWTWNMELASEVRQTSCNRWGWAVPTAKAIECIVSAAKGANCTKILDFGSGRGYWSLLLSRQAEGLEVTAMDSNLSWYQERRHFQIWQGGLDEANPCLADQNTCLLLVWPPCWSKMAEEAVTSFRGRVVVYVGEKEGGKTAAQGFFTVLRAQWQLQRVVPLPNWTRCSDKLFVFTRREIKQD